MATSSILDHITINNPKVIEDYINAMEESANRPISHEASDIKFETDPNVLKELMLKGIEKWGKK
ncbi:MAG: hypothetical protein IJV15_06335 [Lachnospiraceae bacterium]|nr:hypothetical protein [Lachnospiraceae bacterium]